MDAIDRKLEFIRRDLQDRQAQDDLIMAFMVGAVVAMLTYLFA